MIHLLQTIFGSRIKALEILYLLEGAKPAVRQGFYPEELEKVREFCNEKNLFIQLSPYKVLLDDTDSFTNRGKIVPKEHKKGMFFAYISRDELKSLWACLYETQKDHKMTGLALGYPECCSDFFVEQFNESETNPVHQPINPWTNLTKRDKDTVLLSHFPCSSDCHKSICLAKRYHEIIRKHDEALAESIIKELGEGLITE